MSQIEIQILHQDYLLTCPDGQESQLLEAVERVDQQFQKMRDSSKLRSRERVGVLLAINLAFENLELRDQLRALQEQVTALQQANDTAQSECDARLQVLVDQAAHDKAVANQLVERLDRVLQNATDATAPAEQPESAPVNHADLSAPPAESP